MPNKSIENNMYCEQGKFWILVFIFGLFSDVNGLSDSMESQDGIILVGKDAEGNDPRIIKGIVSDLPGETEENWIIERAHKLQILML